jgi:excisionase family DNA binding protein
LDEGLVIAPATTLDSVLRELEQLLEHAAAEDLPEVLGVLERARGLALHRLTQRRLPEPPAAPPAEKPAEKLLTMRQAGERLGVSEDLARRMGRRGEFRTVRVGNRIRVSGSALDQFVRTREMGR